ncbi:DUF1284 domain-containing protein [Salinicola rhizosphaerae]|uniref:(2Fe-2S) ferredoxin n=1 Tax=Salinicola rhizosphaerae TaxID=1443141 RepID=A0ABQ3DZ74_9GAMM|nr:DUF1284 domain-containing protein [Salinicola rhizosphaerae]GHB21035.1 (2Fe-2S) ferredoxin [Salinicola rhizosphaerae]
MTIKLRAHHLLCLLTYVGKGYSEAFIANYDAIAERLSHGEPIRLVEGPDDICAPLLSSDNGEAPHCLRASIDSRDAAARQALERLLVRPLSRGETLSLDAKLLTQLRRAFANGETRRACRACQWESLCSSVAADGYVETRVNDRRGIPHQILP